MLVISYFQMSQGLLLSVIRACEQRKANQETICKNTSARTLKTTQKGISPCISTLSLELRKGDLYNGVFFSWSPGAQRNLQVAGCQTEVRLCL